MGFWNPRAFCPQCGAKIHTRGRRTGRACPMCGVALSKRVALSNVAVPAERAAWEEEAPTLLRRAMRRMGTYWLWRGH